MVFARALRSVHSFARTAHVFTTELMEKEVLVFDMNASNSFSLDPLYTDPMRIDKGTATKAQSEQLSLYNRQRAEAELASSQKLREDIQARMRVTTSMLTHHEEKLKEMVA